MQPHKPIDSSLHRISEVASLVVIIALLFAGILAGCDNEGGPKPSVAEEVVANSNLLDEISAITGEDAADTSGDAAAVNEPSAINEPSTVAGGTSAATHEPSTAASGTAGAAHGTSTVASGTTAAASGAATITSDDAREPTFDLASIPPYEGNPSVTVNNDEPFFLEADTLRSAFEEFAELDELGRCGTAFALVTPETLPTEPRGSIAEIKPSGWQIARYDWVDQTYLYNRCHLIGYQLTGQNANELNLITGTRYMNVQGMEPYEDLVASYVERTGNRVLYRVTPVFEGDNLVATGVLMEALSIDDGGEGIRFCRWCYNVEPGVVIDYATGDNHASES